MGSRDTISEKRQERPEPVLVTDIMVAMEREITLLLGEMEEILRHPTMRYDLFPRLAAALRLYWKARNETLTSYIAQDEARRRLHRLESLEKLPAKDEQMKSEWWRKEFGELKRVVDEEIRESRGVLLPLLSARYSTSELARLGEQFKGALA